LRYGFPISILSLFGIVCSLNVWSSRDTIARSLVFPAELNEKAIVQIIYNEAHLNNYVEYCDEWLEKHGRD
jgi:hypothetical protein